MKKLSIIYIYLGLLLVVFTHAQATTIISQKDTTKEARYYKIVDVPIPEDIVLEVGGLTLTDKDQLGVSTRRGEVWMIDQPYSDAPKYSRYASGLHEVLGLSFRNNGFYLSQRGELTRLEDKDNDGRADLYKTVYAWPLSGNYHDYSYGPKFDANGDMLVTLNLSWIGHGASLVKWRGWLLKITTEGEMTPIATGLRSPAGYVINRDGDIFYSENQGDWVGSGRITHLEKGTFAGNPGGLRWTDDPKSPLKLKPENIAKKSGLSLYQYAKVVPNMKAPAVWLPHTILGISTSDMVYDYSEGKFGPFDGQLFVGDQGHSKIFRVYMEKINGVYQGVAFPFKQGFSSGILKMIWGSDNSMFVGMTSRGWASTGKEMYGLQRLVWTGETPFEIKTMKAHPDGFELEFTKPLDATSAKSLASYKMSTFTYHYHNTYGSPIIDRQNSMIHKAELSKDKTKVKLTVHGMRLGFIHQLIASGIRSEGGEQLLHHTGYYTLNEVPGGVLKSPQMAMPKKTSSDIVQMKRANKAPEAWVNGPEDELTIGTMPGLKFDREELKVGVGKKIKLTFNNNDDMLHNLVIVRPGEAIETISKMSLSMGLDAADKNYVPDSDLVLFHTGILQPESSESIYFEAPMEKGTYYIVCTFPGHAYAMRAKLIIE